MMEILSSCRLCGHACGVDRWSGRRGRCQAGPTIKVAAHLLHHGEEPPISGNRGSGTIFFSQCPLTCVFCQNYQISQEGLGKEVNETELAGMMLDLQSQGAHNINLVSPTPWMPMIVKALEFACGSGLQLPIVYNTGGFDNPEILARLAGLVDIYLPDAKYASSSIAEKYSGAMNYVDINRTAVKEMYRQVGPLRVDHDGLAVSGVLVRHLVLPDDLAGTRQVLAWLAEEFGREVYISLMAQYRPGYLVTGDPAKFPELASPITETDYDELVDFALALGLENVFIQELSSVETYVPDFSHQEVFRVTN